MISSKTLFLLFALLNFFMLSCGSIADEVHASVVPRASYDLTQLKALAAQHNPTLVQAVQLIAGEEGKALQAGLWPNPTVAYIGEQIGLDDTAGEFQGGLIRQRIVTGGKLALSRDKYEARADVARHNLTAQEFRVLNDVEISFYELLGATALLELHDDLLNIAKDHYQTTVELVNIGRKSQADLKMAGVDLQKARLDFFMAQNEQRKLLTSLEAVVGTPLGVAAIFEGNLDRGTEVALPDWELLLAKTLEESPQVLAALDKLRSDEITLKREKREPIPDIVLEAGMGRNIVDDQTVYLAGLSLEIPLFDRNQGTIKQAEAGLIGQRAEVERIKLELTRNFAQEYSHYLTRYRKVLDYQSVVLPESRSAFEMQLEMYKASRINWAEVLTTQSAYVANRVEWIQHLVNFQRHRIALEGFLLMNGLQVPDSPTPPSHIDSVPKPR